MWLVFMPLYISLTLADSSGSISLQTGVYVNKALAIGLHLPCYFKGVCLHMGLCRCIHNYYRERNSFTAVICFTAWGKRHWWFKWELASSPVNHIWVPVMSSFAASQKEERKKQVTRNLKNLKDLCRLCTSADLHTKCFVQAGPSLHLG